jgi:hypothetical protein
MYAEAAREAVSASFSALLPADYDDSIYTPSTSAYFEAEQLTGST